MRTRGLWVETFADHFPIHQGWGDDSAAPFDRRVVAERRGLEGVRLETLEDR